MPDLDDAIDRLYQGPLDTFTEARNALAKSAGRPDVKGLPKPSLPAWAVNQLYWHRRAVIDRLLMAAGALRSQHERALSGKPADLRGAEQAHRDVVKAALAEAKAVLAEGGHPVTPATLDAVRDTLQVLPSPEANGRLSRPLAPRGFEALAGLAVAPARPALRVVSSRTPERPGGADDAEADADAEAERARVQKEAEREARERRKAAEKALDAARAALQRAEIALDDAQRVAARRRVERDAAAAAHAEAAKALRD
jgi:hypothetical protein